MPMSRSWGAPWVTSTPLISSCPPSGTDSPAIRLSKVVLPEPEGPSKHRNSPCATRKSVGASATNWPYCLVGPVITSLSAMPTSCCPLRPSLQDPGVEPLGHRRLVVEPVSGVDLHPIADVVGVARAVPGEIGPDVPESPGLGHTARQIPGRGGHAFRVGTELDELAAGLGLGRSRQDGPTVQPPQVLVPDDRHRRAVGDRALRTRDPGGEHVDLARLEHLLDLRAGIPPDI